MPPKSKRQRVESSSGPVTFFHVNQAVSFLKDEWLLRKNAGAISLDQIVRGVKNERKVDLEVLNKLKMALAEHPSVKVTQGDGDPPDNWYTFRPIYDIKGSEELVLKLQNSGGLLLDHVESSLPSAEKILPKLLNKKILKLAAKNPNKQVLHHNPRHGVAKIELDVNTKNLWQHPPYPREHGDDFDQKILAHLMQGNLSYLPHEIKPSQVSENLKKLARLVAVTFNLAQEAIVLERVIHFGCLYEKSLDTLCQFQHQSKTNQNELTICLQKLVSDRLLQVHSLEDEQFYFVNYQKFYNVVSYKIDILRKGCGADLKENFDEIMQPIIKLLQEPDDFKVVPHILNPRPANPRRFRRDTTGYLNVTPEDEGNALSYSELDGEQIVSINGLEMPPKKRIREEIPPWFQENAVFEEKNVVNSTSVANGNGMPEEGSDQNEEKCRGSDPAVELMYRTATADDVGIMDSSNEDEEDDSVDPQHVDDSYDKKN